MRNITRAAIATAAALTLAVATAPQAHAVGPEVWTQPWEVVGPGADQTDATVRVLDCHTVLVEEKRTDRATRYHRFEGNFPASSTRAAYPQQQSMILTLDTGNHRGWAVIRGWTPQTPSLDWERVVFIPNCADDLSPQTA